MLCARWVAGWIHFTRNFLREMFLVAAHVRFPHVSLSAGLLAGILPRFDAVMPHVTRRMLNQLAKERFGNQFDAEMGVVRFTKPQRLKDGLEQILKVARAIHIFRFSYYAIPAMRMAMNSFVSQNFARESDRCGRRMTFHLSMLLKATIANCLWAASNCQHTCGFRRRFENRNLRNVASCGI